MVSRLSLHFENFFSKSAVMTVHFRVSRENSRLKSAISEHSSGIAFFASRKTRNPRCLPAARFRAAFFAQRENARATGTCRCASRAFFACFCAISAHSSAMRVFAAQKRAKPRRSAFARFCVRFFAHAQKRARDDERRALFARARFAR